MCHKGKKQSLEKGMQRHTPVYIGAAEVAISQVYLGKESSEITLFYKEI